MSKYLGNSSTLFLFLPRMEITISRTNSFILYVPASLIRSIIEVVRKVFHHRHHEFLSEFRKFTTSLNISYISNFNDFPILYLLVYSTAPFHLSHPPILPHTYTITIKTPKPHNLSTAVYSQQNPNSQFYSRFPLQSTIPTTTNLSSLPIHRPIPLTSIPHDSPIEKDVQINTTVSCHSSHLIPQKTIFPTLRKKNQPVRRYLRAISSEYLHHRIPLPKTHSPITSAPTKVKKPPSEAKIPFKTPEFAVNTGMYPNPR